LGAVGFLGLWVSGVRKIDSREGEQRRESGKENEDQVKDPPL